MHSLWFLLFASLSSIVEGATTGTRLPPKCTKDPQVRTAVSSLRSQSSGGAFCSSYLHYTTSTTTSTVTPPDVTETETTYTATVTDPPASTVTDTESTTITSCITTPNDKLAKRQQSTPVPTPSALKTLNRKEKSRACSCLNFPKPTATATTTAGQASTTTTTVSKATTTDGSGQTVTTTTTTTFTSNSCAAPTTCGNQGLQYAAYHNNQGDNNGGQYNNYDPQYLKSASPYYNDTTTTIGGINNPCNSNTISVYGSSQSFSCQYFSLNHRGYIYAPETGSYSFTVSNVDDIVIIWSGSLAKSGWNKANADLVVPFSANSGTKSYNLNKGDYLPLRIVFGQAQVAATFQLTLTDPNGNTLLSSNSHGSPYVIQYSCDQSTAPPFPYTFGNEF